MERHQRMQIEISEQAIINSVMINNVGIAAAHEGADALHAGIAMIRRAMNANPLDLGYRTNLATFLLEQGKDEEAEELVIFVLKRNENHATAWQIMGVINTDRGRMSDAVACFKRAYDIEPHIGQRKFDLAAAYLRAGDFANGLPLYEFRGEILPKTGTPPDAPTWKGEKTGHLAIWPDQGYGDFFMFTRFVPWAKERAEKITLLMQPNLLPLFQGYSQVADIKAVYATDIKFDHQICVASLPLVYGLTPDNIPPDPGFLTAAESIGTLPSDGLKIGIAWQGNPQFPGDKMRSIPFREFLPLAADPRNTIYSLQVGPASADIAKARAARIVKDMSSQIEGAWQHTAALIKNLDLVVSSCTAIPHLAGALGVPTFIIIPQFADWRWLNGRDDTPWYPHTRLFRQTKAGQWNDVVERVMKAVDEIHHRRDLVKILNRAHAATPHYEPEVVAVMRKVLRPGDIFVDVGANVGKHTIEAARIVGPTGKVFAFEPGTNCLPTLRDATRHLAQVKIIPHPAWHTAGEVTFHLNADDSGGNAMWDPGDWPGPHNPKSKELKQPIVMLATTLDIECDCLPRLIKIDTEGAEQRVLEGASRLLAEAHPPFIIAELHEFGLQKLGCSQESLRRYMESHGYSTFFLFADGALPQLVPPKTTIKTGFIVNILFSTPEAVGEAWSDEPVEISSLRPFWGYGVPKETASAA